jgi:predicted transcriptional regulator
MVKKSLSIEIPESLVVSLDELAKTTGRKKNLLVGALLLEFLNARAEEQEEIIKRYLMWEKRSQEKIVPKGA